MVRYIYLLMAVLLLLCLAPMPYGYYQLVRFVAMVAFAVMAWNYYEKSMRDGRSHLGHSPCYSSRSSRLHWGARYGMW